MSVESLLMQIGEKALPSVLDLLARIVSSPDQAASARRAAAALESDALDAATDVALDEALSKLKG